MSTIASQVNRSNVYDLVFREVRRFMSSPYFIAVSIFFSFFWGLGWVPLFDLDEGAFTEATREMIASGNYSATYLDGEPRYDKPIFFYWLQATSIHLFGFNEWAFRLPSVLMASLWALSLYLFCKEFLSRQRAVIATLFLVNSIWVALIARSAIADATLNLFLTLTIFDIWRFIQKRQSKYVYRVYFWMALGTLTKGPIAIAVPLATSALFIILNKEYRDAYKAYFNPIGWCIFLATVSPWLYAVYLEQGSGFFQGFIVEHNLKRFSDTRENHGGSIFYYVIALPFIVLPLTGLLHNIAKNIRTHLKSPLNQYLLIWFGLIFCLFSFSKTQLPHYILNACVPLFILLASQKNLFNKSRYASVFAVVFMIFLCALPQVIAQAAASSKGFDAAVLARHNEVFDSAYLIYAGITCVLVSIVAFLKPLRVWQRLALCGLLINLFMYTSFARVASDFKETPIHQAIAFLDSYTNKNADDKTVVAFRMHMPSFSVYRQKITPLREPKPGEIALTRVDRLDDLMARLGDTPSTILFESGGLVLVEVHKH